MSIEFLANAASGAAAEAAAKNKFGLVEALNEGGPISWSIFIVLVIMSVFSFYISVHQADRTAEGSWSGQDRACGLLARCIA